MTTRRYFDTEGIVVRTRNLGESDRIVILLTPNRGLVHCVARRARNTKSKLAGQTDLLRHITASINAGRSDLHVISQVETINAHLPLHTDLDRLTLASHMAESAEQFCTEDAPNPAVFRLLNESLTNAETAAPDMLPLLQLWHDLQLLTVSGWEPELHHCVRTGITLQEGDHWWSANEGGVVAHNYARETRGGGSTARHHIETARDQRTQTTNSPASDQESDAQSTAPVSDPNLESPRSDPPLPAQLPDPALTAPLTSAPVNALKLLRYMSRPNTTWQRLTKLRTPAEHTDSAQRLVTRMTEAVLERRTSRSARVAREVRGR